MPIDVNSPGGWIGCWPRSRGRKYAPAVKERAHQSGGVTMRRSSYENTPTITILSECFATQVDGLRLAFGFDDGGVRLHFGLLLGKTRPGGFLLLHHFGLDSFLEHAGETDILEHQVIQRQEVLNLFSRASERTGFDLFALLHNHLRGAQGGEFLERFGHAWLNQTGKRVALIISKKRYHLA